MEAEYYERYWRGEIGKEGFATVPPEWNASNLRTVLGFFSPVIHGRVLDVGCGDGFFAHEISKLGGVEEVVGLDVSETAIKIAQGRYPHIEFLVAPITDVPLPDAYFDTISAIEVVEHVLDVPKMFEEFNRLVKIGGHICSTTTDFNLLKRMIISLLFFEKYFRPDNPHIRFFTKRTLAEMLLRHQFEITRYGWSGSYWRLMPKGQMVVARKTEDCAMALKQRL